MGLWPFGREPSDVELASRVVTAMTRDQRRVRGKLTMHFAAPQTQAAADAAVDECAALAVSVLQAAESATAVLGSEPQIVAELVARLPPHIAPTRAVELNALHVVDASEPGMMRRPSGGMAAVDPTLRRPSTTMGAVDPASLGRPSGMIPAVDPVTLQRPSGTIPAVTPSGRPLTPVTGVPLSVPIVVNTRPLSEPPGARPTPMRRGSSTRLHAVRIAIPPGATPAAVAAAIGPAVRDSAARILVGALRAYDLIVVRRLSLDDSPELRSALVPISEVPLGAFESSRAHELGRWEAALGSTGFARVHRETRVLAVYLAHAGIRGVGLAPPVTLGILGALCAVCFAEHESPFAVLANEPDDAPSRVHELTDSLVRAMVTTEDAPGLGLALEPLLADIQEYMAFVANLIQHANPRER